MKQIDIKYPSLFLILCHYRHLSATEILPFFPLFMLVMIGFTYFFMLLYWYSFEFSLGIRVNACPKSQTKRNTPIFFAIGTCILYVLTVLTMYIVSLIRWFQPAVPQQNERDHKLFKIIVSQYSIQAINLCSYFIKLWNYWKTVEFLMLYTRFNGNSLVDFSKI